MCLCAWDSCFNLQLPSFKGVTVSFSSQYQAVVVLQAAFRGHLARQKLLLSSGLHDAQSYNRQSLGRKVTFFRGKWLSRCTIIFTLQSTVLPHLIPCVTQWSNLNALVGSTTVFPERYQVHSLAFLQSAVFLRSKAVIPLHYRQSLCPLFFFFSQFFHQPVT